MRSRLAVAVVVILLAGCGGSHGSGNEPASIVPGSAYLYVEANLDPSGDQETAARTVLGALPGVSEPARRLQEQFNAYALDRYGRNAANFDRVIKPWLGSRMAAFSLLPPGRSAERAPSGLVAATRDTKKAMHWLFVVSRRMAERERTYKGVRYLYTRGAEPMASGVVDGFVVAADETAFKAAVDSARGAPLADRPRFAKTMSRATDDRLGLVW